MNLDLYIPNIYCKSIYTINYKKLKKNGIKCLLFDLENTIVPYKAIEPDVRIKELFSVLEHDFKIIIISNASKNKVRPFKEILNVDAAYRSWKPYKNKYKQILTRYKYQENEVACIGDQILTDVLGANKMGLTSILVNKMSRYETLPTRINRALETIILKRLAKNKILVKGEYYD